MKHVSTKAIFGAITLALAIPVTSIAADLKVGFITSLSGSSASMGIPYDKGIRAGITYQPTVDGKKIDVVTLDDGSDPSTAARNARKLIVDDKVDVLIGTPGTPSALAIAGVARELKVPFICNGNATLPGEEGSWMVTLPQPAELMIAGDVQHMKENGVKTVGYIGFSDAWGDMVYNALVKLAPEAGIKVVSNERYARADTSVTGQILKVVAKKPDAVLTGTSGTPGALPYLALKDRGYKGKIYGTHAIINPDFIRVGGASVENIIAPTGPVVVVDQLPDTHPMKKIGLAYQAAYEKTFNAKPTDAFAPYSFDAWLIFENAAKQALKTQQPGTAAFHLALRDAIVNMKELVGTQSIYNFKPGNTFGSDERAVAMVQLVNGKWKYIGK